MRGDLVQLTDEAAAVSRKEFCPVCRLHHNPMKCEKLQKFLTPGIENQGQFLLKIQGNRAVRFAN